MKPTPKHAGWRKWWEAEDEPLYKPSIFLYVFWRLKICDISSIPNVKRPSDRRLKIRQYIRYQNKTYIYLFNQKKTWVGPSCPTFPMTWLFVPHCLYPTGGVQWAILRGENFMAIFTTLSVVISFSTDTLGIFATLVYVFTIRHT